MIRGFMILLLCQLVGEIVARILSLPVPGPVVGMLMLWVALSGRRSAPPVVARDCPGGVAALPAVIRAGRRRHYGAYCAAPTRMAAPVDYAHHQHARDDDCNRGNNALFITSSALKAGLPV